MPLIGRFRNPWCWDHWITYFEELHHTNGFCEVSSQCSLLMGQDSMNKPLKALKANKKTSEQEPTVFAAQCLSMAESTGFGIREATVFGVFLHADA